ncbi:homoserine O-acetyltransferase MetX [Sulfobacillus thermosulfidooxidans]|uniref:homoserine O-acetyltransferase MetX n=1 Tax=Sulfobacillus thermosulfidooxidans TaxID=28034 RepID=UPI00096BAE89|nr:homoserine O-acetyltransferase [Sulfobacillus thermosulfidooxidans]OLZ09907.1 homoserine O-acetyltransferase [Sulfobacillus thermosulfidooxidans]OLZ15787.1 homoserine O-acetyltransferase [Sulfobacillus thermosulfidooxidans]OLZ18365.1 homoserine O-acetyltransferase [Sulfobacillus thermosulfidooxidans]
MKMTKYPYPIWPWQLSQGFPWPRLQFLRTSDPFRLDSGDVLPELLIAYEEWGQIGKGTPIVIFHALTGDSHVTRHTYQDSAGWWDNLVGFGKPIDLHQYHVISLNVLGGAMGSTGPHSPAEDGHPYGGRFPKLSLFDMARAAKILIDAVLGDRDKPLVIGGSMGGMMAYAYAMLYPETLRGILTIGSPIWHSPWAIAFHTVGRQAIMSDPYFNGGNYYLTGAYPSQGLALARMADMISYQSPKSMDTKFGRLYQTPERDEFQITSYLRYQGQKLVRRFDANTYIRITEAMDRFDLREGDLSKLRNVPVWMVGITSDQLYPYDEIRQHANILRDAGINVRFETLHSPWGHDSFLVDIVPMGKILRRFLQVMSHAMVN